MVIGQPKALASERREVVGNRKMPAPIILPTTSARHIQKPDLTRRCLDLVGHFAPGLGTCASGLAARPNANTGDQMRAFLFPGQGSQAVGMGAALAEASRAARDVFEEVDEALGQNLFRLMREGPDEDPRLTENAQPAIMAHALAVFAR